MMTLFFPRLSNAATLTLAWDPPRDTSTAGFLLSYGTVSHSYSQWVNVGNATTYTLTQLTDGATYYFAVRAYNVVGDMSAWSTEVSATMASRVPVVTAVGLQANVPSPQVVGSSVQWVATATGGVAPYQYRWALNLAGTATWKASAWGSSSSSTWTPLTPGNYQIAVAVRSAGSTSPNGELGQVVLYTMTVPPPITLFASLGKSKNVRVADLIWNGASGSQVDIYRNNIKILTTPNDGAQTDQLPSSGTYIYKVCLGGTSTCSNTATVAY